MTARFSLLALALLAACASAPRRYAPVDVVSVSLSEMRSGAEGLAAFESSSALGDLQERRRIAQAFCSGSGAPPPGQETEPPTPGTKARSPAVAGLLEWFLPTVGFAYAGDWPAGLLPNAVRIGGIVLAGSTMEFNFLGGETECSAECKAGFVLALAGSIWAIAGAVMTAEDFNERLREAPAQVTILPSRGGGVRIGVRVQRW